MNIFDMMGNLLIQFPADKISSVALAEKWIKEHGLEIWKCELLNGIFCIIVRRQFYDC